MDLSGLLSHSGEPLDRLGRARRCIPSSWIEQTHTMGRRLVKATTLKTAFRTCNGCLKYQTMHLPATFQAYNYTEAPGQTHEGVVSIRGRPIFED